MADTEGGQGSAPKGLWMPGRGQWGGMEGLRAGKRQTFRKVTVVGGLGAGLQPGCPGIRGDPCVPLLAECIDSPPKSLGCDKIGTSPPPPR